MTDRETFRTSRDDGRFVSTLGFLHAYAKANPPKLAFRPDMDAADLPAWRERVQTKLRELLRFPEVPQPPPVLLSDEPREGYRLQRWECYPEPLLVVPYLVLVPDGVSEQSPAPAVLCCPGSDWSKESLAGEPELDGRPPKNHHWANNRQALFYAQQGLVAVAVDNPGIAEQSDPIHPERHEVSMNGLWLGRPYEGLMAYPSLKILEWLKNLPCVSRVATSGLSLGSKPALTLALLDPEVVACVFNDFTCQWRTRMIVSKMDRISIHQYVPDLLQWLDYPDLMAAYAPRPLLLSEGGRTEEINLVRRAYELAGAPDALDVVYYPKYATPDLRPYDDVPMPEGLTGEEYFEYANVDVPQHEFHPEVCVPWLVEKLKGAS